MADIQAFRAFRYDLGRAGALGDLVAPPYDVIDSELQDTLYKRGPYNVIRLILNKETPADTDLKNRYTRAAQALRDWQREGIVVQDSARSLYVYHQEFEVEGRATRGAASWPESGWNHSGKGAFFRTNIPCPVPKRTVSS